MVLAAPTGCGLEVAVIDESFRKSCHIQYKQSHEFSHF